MLSQLTLRTCYNLNSLCFTFLLAHHQCGLRAAGHRLLIERSGGLLPAYYNTDRVGNAQNGIEGGSVVVILALSVGVEDRGLMHEVEDQRL